VCSSDLAMVAVRLSAAETRALLQQAPEAYRTEINDLLLAALAESLGAALETERLMIALEGHGREALVEGVDLSRTVGWCTSLFPVRLPRVGGGPGALLKAVKEQLRRIPQRGLGYGVLRYLGPAATRTALAGLGAPEVAFNYLGQIDAGLEPAGALRRVDGPMGPMVAGSWPRGHLLEINGLVAAGRLQLVWSYNPAVHAAARVTGWAEGFLAALRGLIAHCCAAENWGRTPSDFPLAQLEQGTLDRLLAGRRDIEDLYPLSPLQHGLLFHTLHETQAGAYFVQIGLGLEGAGFRDLETFETLMRTWHVAERSVRPDHRMVAHTGFVTIGRRGPQADPVSP